MAETIMSSKQMKITVPANTDEHTIVFSSVLKDTDGTALVTMLTGTSVQFCSDGAIVAASLALSSSGNNTKDMFQVSFNSALRYKGGAGSETFNINIID